MSPVTKSATDQLDLPFNGKTEAPQSPLPIGQSTHEDEDSNKVRLRQLLLTGLLFYRHQISENTKAIAHEASSDSPAFHAAAKSGASSDVFSSGVAVALIALMIRQRMNATRELRATLKIWSEYQQNRITKSSAETYDILEKRLRESGIIFENLPDQDLMNFKAKEFNDLARTYLGRPSDEPLQPLSIKNIWNSAKNAGIKGSHFIGHFVSDFVENIFHVDELPGLFKQSATACAETFNKFSLLRRATREKHKIIKDTAVDNALASSIKIDDLDLVQSGQYPPELMEELRKTRSSVKDFIGQDKEAAVLLMLQTLFIGGQVASCAANFVKGDSGAAYINLACINAATVAWRVLAQNKLHLRDALEGERAKLSEKYAVLTGIEPKKPVATPQQTPATIPALESANDNEQPPADPAPLPPRHDTSPEPGL